MSFLKLSLVLLMFLSLNACTEDPCDCTEDWEESKSYSMDSLVKHNGECYKAISSGRGILPGPWMENKNDIWVLCED